MRIKVLFFGSAGEVVGGREVWMEMTIGSTVGDLKRRIVERYPPLALAVSKLKIGVNGEYVEECQALGNGDEVAVLPPVSGGSWVWGKAHVCDNERTD